MAPPISDEEVGRLPNTSQIQIGPSTVSSNRKKLKWADGMRFDDLAINVRARKITTDPSNNTSASFCNDIARWISKTKNKMNAAIIAPMDGAKERSFLLTRPTTNAAAIDIEVIRAVTSPNETEIPFADPVITIEIPINAAIKPRIVIRLTVSLITNQENIAAHSGAVLIMNSILEIEVVIAEIGKSIEASP